ncbi:hypothetical protein DM860_008119 [Cuscuta australis]|uniref:Uncharacterized protein n=1 Tax=Cuscuta australis TaxID=267555 RepID=A0A328D6K9_9ASTE|nr:hypothetical protein DM860_008119 [Cuscuta australis]
MRMETAASIRDEEKNLAASIGDEDEHANRMNGVESDEQGATATGIHRMEAAAAAFEKHAAVAGGVV